MRRYFDLDSGLFLENPGQEAPLQQITAKRGANNPLFIRFIKDGQTFLWPTGTQFAFSGKPQKQFDNNYAVYAGPGAWTGPDADGFYSVIPAYDGAGLNLLFGYTYPTIDTLPHVASISLDGEIAWLPPGDAYWTKTDPWTLLVYNDVMKGNEDLPFNSSTFRRGTFTLASGFDAFTVSGLSLPSAPAQIVVTVKKPGSAQYNLYATVRDDGTITADGFTFDLNAATDMAGYKVDYLIFC